jgi:hypothetical protein
MPTPLTLFGYTPPARYDRVPWTAARIEQSSTETGPYTLVEEIPLTPVDLDPAVPDSRSFTTELATPGDFYRIVWADTLGGLSDPTSPVQFVTATAAYATRAELAAILKVNETQQAAALDRVLLAAAGEINNEIGHLDLTGWQRALAEEVNLERAVEHWQQRPFGIISLGPDVGASHTSRDTWERHAIKLTPLKQQWGIA